MSRTLNAAWADLTATIHQCRLIFDSAAETLESNGLPAADVLALSSRMIDAEMKLLDLKFRIDEAGKPAGSREAEPARQPERTAEAKVETAEKRPLLRLVTRRSSFLQQETEKQPWQD